MSSFGVTVAVLAESQVVVQLRADAGMWCLPGGAVEPGESLAEAAVREVREETGLEVRLTQLVGVYSRPRWREGGDHQVLFAATLVGGDLRRFELSETLDARFADPNALPDPFLWWHRRMVADAVAGVGGARTWTLDAVWPFEADRRALTAQVRRDPALADRVRATFSALPAPEAERLEVGAP